MNLPEWYYDLKIDQKKRARKLFDSLAKKEAQIQPIKDDLQKLRRIAAVNRHRKKNTQ